jgi:hypothetical protein
LLWQVVHEVWYFRENAGIAEVLGTDASIIQSTTRNEVTIAAMLVLSMRPFIYLPPNLAFEQRAKLPEPTDQAAMVCILPLVQLICRDVCHLSM